MGGVDEQGAPEGAATPDETTSDETTSEGAPTGGSMSRRKFLTAVAAVGGTAAMGAILWQAFGDDDDDDGSRGSAASPKRNAAAGQPEVVTLHFALGHASGVDTAKLHVAGKRYPLVVHTPETLGAIDGLPAGVDTALLTHFAQDVSLPPIVLQVNVMTGDADAPIAADTRLLASRVHVPTAVRLQEWANRSKLESALHSLRYDAKFRQVVADAAVGRADIADVSAALAKGPAVGAAIGGTAARWARLGLKGGAVPTTPEAAAALATIADTSYDSAVTMVMKHPEVMSLDPTGAARALDVIALSGAVLTLADTITERFQADGDSGSLGTFVPLVDADNKPMTLAGTPTADGVMPDQQLVSLKHDPAYDATLQDAVTEVVGMVKASDTMQDYSWHDLRSTPPDEVDGGAGLQSVVADVVMNGAVTRGATNGLKVTFDSFEGSDQGNKVNLEVSNDYLRHLSVGVGFYDANGKGMKLNEGFDYGANVVFRTITNSNPYVKLLFVAPSAPTILGVTLQGQNTQKFSIKMPVGAELARIYLASAGGNTSAGDMATKMVDEAGKPAFGDATSYPDAWYGILMTLILDLGVPAMLLVTAARSVSNMNTQIYKDLFGGTAAEAEEVGKDFALIRQTMIGFAGAAAAGAAVVVGAGAGSAELRTVSVDTTGWKLMKDIGLDIFKILGSGFIAKAVWKQVLKSIGTSEAEDAIPFLGDILAVVSVIENATKLATASVEVASADIMTTAEVSISYTATVTLKPDSSAGSSPGDAVLPRATKAVEVTYSILGNPTPQVFTQPVDFSKGVDTYEIKVPNVAFGPWIQWKVHLTSGSDQVGTGSSPWLNGSTQTLATDKIDIAVKQLTIPIRSTTVLEPSWTTVGTATAVTDGKANTGTAVVDDLDCTVAATMCEIDGVTVATRLGAVGYVWNADGKYHARNLSTIGDPMKGWNQAGPFGRRPHLVYDAWTADLDGAHNFLFDPTGEVGYAVRRVSVDNATKAPNMGIDPAKAVGRFPMDLDDVAYNPAGVLVGINTQSARLAVLPFLNQGVDDYLAPTAQLFAGKGDRPGLMQLPTLVTCTRLGAIVVLDAGDPPTLRVFGIDGNPIPTADGTPLTVALDDSEPRTYVGLAADGGGYVYVLSYGADKTVDSYAIEVFDPKGQPVVTWPGTNAGRLAVDFWQTAYTLAYSPMLGPDGTPRIDPTTKTVEPALTQWLPRNP